MQQLVAIVEMHRFLSSNYNAYCSISKGEGSMTDAERDEIHMESTSFVSQCRDGIDKLRKLMVKTQDPEDSIAPSDDGTGKFTSPSYSPWVIDFFIFTMNEQIIMQVHR